MGAILPPRENFFTVSISRKNVSKYAKLMLESYICGNLNHNHRFFSFLRKKKFETRKSSETHIIDFFRTCMTILYWYLSFAHF